MSTGLAVVLGIVAGLAVGAVIAWAVRSRGLKQVELERDKARDESDEQREALAELRAQLASVEADRAARVEEMAKQQAEIEGRFKEIAAQVSETTRDAFMKEFRDLTAEQTKTAGKTVSDIIEPMRERLRELQEHVNKADKARVADTATVTKGVEQLVSETSGLRQILRDSKMRGAWGEQHLRNVIEAAGLRDQVDFEEQPSIEGGSDDRRGRPDFVVKIPGGAHVIIDAKTPFGAFDRAMQSKDVDEQRRLLGEHAIALSERAKELGGRNYEQMVPGSPDFVLMYVPTDPMLDVAMDVDRDIWQRAWDDHKVLIATPGLLIAFLKTVAMAWKRQAIEQDAEQIAELGSELYSRLSRYLRHVEKMGRGLRSAVDAYNDSVGSFERRVLPQARRFEDWAQTTSRDELNEPPHVDKVVDTINAPELESGDD